MKKFLAIMLAAVMMLSVCTLTVSADTNGTIAINGLNPDATYSIYKLLNLESYNVTNQAYSYTVAPEWAEFFEEPEALAYISINEQGYVSWIGDTEDEAVAAFSQLALAYAAENGIAPVKTSANAGDFTVDGNVGKFEGLELGYYLVDTTAGIMCALTTTAPNGVVNAKNGIPIITKTVIEDSTNQPGDKNTADIGQMVDYIITVTVHKGAQNYVVHDQMAQGLTFKGVTKVEYINPDDTAKSKVCTEGGEYTLRTAPGITEITTDDTDHCTFEVVFSPSFMEEIEENDKVIIYYTAMLNRNATIAGDGNPNDAWITFGEGHTTTPVTTRTYTYAFDLLKTDGSNNFLEGATFRIYDAATGGSEVKVVELSRTADEVIYRRARADEAGTLITMIGGKAKLVGFDNGAYYLEEIDVPAGYNRLAARHRFVISDGNLEAQYTGGAYSVGSGVQVINKTGMALPETGGFGTTMFVVIGGLMVVAAGVLLVTKKRVSKFED